MSCNRMDLDGYCALSKTNGECDICKRNHEIYESRKISTIVERMNEASNVHELNQLYSDAEKMLFDVYEIKFQRLLI